ncbi:hypothetical protein [Burkholderia cenocepacia]|uniref:hypothetical protein n=1 Tax=Burkholderia cenocepacia TaxID=95486 RepID=UPI0006AC5FFE|nr:hypothetical protein [Burkholderia cenocepacia]KOR17665.1 hypothetical protein ABW54_30900 [Burkholderia cenocepacia]
MTSPCLSHGLAVAGFAFGVAGAWFWFLSARVQFKRPPARPAGPTDPNDPMAFEPVVPEAKPGWYAYWQRKETQGVADATEANWTAMVEANREMGRLNTIAAGLTAVAVLCSTASTLVN